MNRDALLATIIGFGIGLVIAGIVFMGPAIAGNLPNFKLPNLSFFTKMLEKKTPSTTPTPTPTNPSDLTIESPLAESIEPKNETLISGTTHPNATVVLEGTTSESVATANAKGAYAGKLTLSEGKNEIVVTSYSDKGVFSQTVTVYYTEEQF